MGDTRLIVDPKNEIIFTGPYDQIVSSWIKLTNTTSQRVCFKIKTTVPKSYCVKPSSGILGPNETISVEVMLHPMTHIPPDQGKHKFMVQSLVAPDNDDADLESLWREAKPGDLQDTKLQCVMRMPEDVVAISPSSALTFQGPFDRKLSAVIRITNTSQSNICFKIQITNPKQFLVIPVSGLIESNKSQIIQVVMDAPALASKLKCKDRFMVQWISTPNHSVYEDSVWKDVQAIKDRILRCVLKQPGETSNETETVSAPAVVNESNNEQASRAQLMMELQQLKQENKVLKENDLRLRRIGLNDSSGAGRAASVSISNPMPYSVIIGLLIVALIVGLILGRVIF